jgi:hypothetical protein
VYALEVVALNTSIAFSSLVTSGFGLAFGNVTSSYLEAKSNGIAGDNLNFEGKYCV